jgi:hypothetical protein
MRSASRSEARGSSGGSTEATGGRPRRRCVVAIWVVRAAPRARSRSRAREAARSRRGHHSRLNRSEGVAESGVGAGGCREGREPRWRASTVGRGRDVAEGPEVDDVGSLGIGHGAAGAHGVGLADSREAQGGDAGGQGGGGRAQARGQGRVRQAGGVRVRGEVRHGQRARRRAAEGCRRGGGQQRAAGGGGEGRAGWGATGRGGEAAGRRPTEKGKKRAGADPAALARKETSRARHRRLEETAQVRGPVGAEGDGAELRRGAGLRRPGAREGGPPAAGTGRARADPAGGARRRWWGARPGRGGKQGGRGRRGRRLGGWAAAQGSSGGWAGRPAAAAGLGEAPGGCS